MNFRSPLRSRRAAITYLEILALIALVAILIGLFFGYSGISVGKIIERKASDTRLGEDRVYRRRRGSWCGSWRKSESLARWL